MTEHEAETLIGKVGGAKRVMSILVTATILYMYATGLPVPDSLLAAWMLIMGTYFGQSIAAAKSGGGGG